MSFGNMFAERVLKYKSILISFTGILLAIVFFIVFISRRTVDGDEYECLKHSNFSKIKNSELLDLVRLKVLPLRDYLKSFNARIKDSELLLARTYRKNLDDIIMDIKENDFIVHWEGAKDGDDNDKLMSHINIKTVGPFGFVRTTCFPREEVKDLLKGNISFEWFHAMTPESLHPKYDAFAEKLKETKEDMCSLVSEVVSFSGMSDSSIRELFISKNYISANDNTLFPALIFLVDNSIKENLEKNGGSEAEIVKEKIIKVSRKIRDLEDEYSSISTTSISLRRAFLLDKDFFTLIRIVFKAKQKLEFIAEIIYSRKKELSRCQRQSVMNLAMLSNRTGSQGYLPLEVLDMCSDEYAETASLIKEITITPFSQFWQVYPTEMYCPLLHPIGRPIVYEDVLKLLHINLPSKKATSSTQDSEDSEEDSEEESEEDNKYMKKVKGGYALDKDLLKKDFKNHKHIKLINRKKDFVETKEEAKTISFLLQNEHYARLANFTKAEFESITKEAMEMQAKLFPSKAK